MLTVLKPFPHPSRRFAVGDEVTEVDLIGAPMSVADLKKGKFLAGSDTQAAEKAAAKADEMPPRGDDIPVPENATRFQEELAVKEAGLPTKR